MSHSAKLLIIFTLSFALAALTSCSIPFNRAYRKASATSSTTNPQDLAGAWQGTWSSEGTGHHGKLRAVVTPDSTKPNTWTFRYHATWAKILSGGYTTQHIATPLSDGSFQIGGEHDLGKLFGGVFKYTGTATPLYFRANYQSSNDHGVFKMHRPQLEPKF